MHRVLFDGVPHIVSHDTLLLLGIGSRGDLNIMYTCSTVNGRMPPLVQHFKPSSEPHSKTPMRASSLQERRSLFESELHEYFVGVRAIGEFDSAGQLSEFFEPALFVNVFGSFV